MITRTLSSPLSLCLAILIGWVGGILYQGRATQNAVVLCETIRKNDLRTRADDAYKSATTEIATWELEYLASQLAKDHDQLSSSKSARLQLFVANARLVRLYVEQDKTIQAQMAFQMAT